MTIIRKREIRQMPEDERRRRLDEIRTEVVRLRTTIQSGGTVENTRRMRELRRTIARILTIENEIVTRGVA